MPAKNPHYWESRSGEQGTTWYQDRWLDWYTDRMWKDAYRRLGVDVAGKSVIDVGCGDGKYSHFLKAEGAKVVVGVDLFDYDPQSAEGVAFRHSIDAEKLSSYGFGHFDLAVVSGVLEFVKSREVVLVELAKVAEEAMIIEEIQETIPEYKKGLDYERPFTWKRFQDDVWCARWRIARWVPMNVLDRGIIVHVPKWLWWFICGLTLVLDWFLVRWPLFRFVKRHTRFRALHLVRLVR
ncbi:hypothetical protein ES705_27594 [subsurface metagenome]